MSLLGYILWLRVNFSGSITSGLFALQLTLGLCAGVALELRPPETTARLLIKINVKNQCLAMLVKPEPKPPCC